MSNKSKLFFLLCWMELTKFAFGHGMMMDPVNRASRWRIDGSSPKNYDDNGLNCGGFGTQWNTYNGKCGMCGDSFGDPKPRANEDGGPFGKGVIVKTYKQGDMIDVTVKITANHMGYFYFKICNLDKETESEECFDKFSLKTDTGKSNYTLPSRSNQDFKLKLQLPNNLNCNHCVLQWTYRAGNNWGICPDGTGKQGCGKQEHFRNCADITIKGNQKAKASRLQRQRKNNKKGDKLNEERKPRKKNDSEKNAKKSP